MTLVGDFTRLARQCLASGRLRRTCSLLLIGCALSTSAKALHPQRSILQFAHSTWTNAQGAPSSVQTIQEGNDGYLWIGAEDGLYRFDGVTFEVFEGDASLPVKGASVTYMTKAPDGAILSVVGSSAMRIDNGKVAALSMTGWPANRTQVVVDLDGVYWTRTRNGELWRIENGKPTSIDATWKYPFAGRTGMLLVDRKGGLRVLGTADENVLIHLPRGARQFVIAAKTDAAELAEAPDGSIWLTSSVGLSVVSPGAPASASAVVLSTDPYGKPMFDRDGGLWIESTAGLALIGHPETLLQGGAMATLRGQTMTPQQGLTADVVWTLVEDHEGNVWAGTSGGLDRFRATPITPVPLPRRTQFFAVAAAEDGAVWAANYNGALMHVDKLTIDDVPGVGPYIGKLLNDGHGGTWALSQKHALWHAEKGGAFQKFAIPSDFYYDYVVSSTVDAQGDLWIGFPNGVAKVSRGQWLGIQSSPALPKDYAALRMTTDRKGRVWLGGIHDIKIIDGASTRTLTSAANGVLSGRLRQIYEKSMLWLLTTDGVGTFEGDRFHELKRSDGLPFRGFNSLVEASNGDVWLHGAREELRIPAAELGRALQTQNRGVRVERFDERDGLRGSSSYYPTPSLIEGSDGRLWFASNVGIAWLDPGKLPIDRGLPPVRIRALEADGKNVALDAVEALPQLTNRIELAYTSLVLGTPEKVRYRYRLAESKFAWTEVGNARAAVFTNLSPGIHRFEVAAKIGSAPRSESTVLGLRIKPAWYQTHWFYAGCALLFLLFLWILHRVHLRRATAILRLQLDAKQSERERIARDLHDTLLQTVYGLMLRFEIVANHFQAADPQRQIIDEALDHADRTIVEGRNRLSDLRSTLHLDSDLPASLRKVGEELVRDHPSTTFSFRFDGAVPSLEPLVESETRMIVIEALTNAFRHAHATSVLLDISSAKNQWVVRVRDDGIGIGKDLLESGRAQHWGIQGMRERAKLIGATLEVSSETGEGTEIRLTLPGTAAFA